MDPILEKKQERADKVEQQKKLVNKAENENRDLTDNEEKRFKVLDTEINDLDAEIEKIEKKAEEEKRELAAKGIKKQNNLVAVDRSYRGMFYEGRENVSLPDGGFESLNEYMQVIRSGRYDERLLAVRDSMNEAIPSEGGFVVPTQYTAQILDDSLEKEIIRPLATVWPMESNKRKIPTTGGKDRSDGDVYGGLDIEWLNEGSTATKQTFKLEGMEIVAEKGAIYIDVSNELLEDGMNMEAQLKTIVGNALSFGLDKAFINGDGAGKPQGILNSNALIEVTRSSANQIITDDVVNMYARFYKDDLSQACWIINNDCIAQILQLVQVAGTGGSGVYFTNFEKGVPMTLLGLPVKYTEKCPALGSTGDIILANLKHYGIGMRKYMKFDKSNAPGWTEDETSFRMILRINGQSTFSEAITPTNGSNDISPFVTLAA